MTYGFNTPPSSGSEVCPVCSEIYPAAQPNCPKCGFVRGTVQSSGAEQPTPGVQVTYTGSTGRNWIALAAVLITLLGGGLALFVGLDVRNRVSSAFDDVFHSNDAGGIFGSNDSQSTDHISTASCRKKLTSYLRRLFVSLNKADADATSAVFLKAATELGGGSHEYQSLVDIYSSFGLTSLAAQGHPRKALDKAIPRVEKACR
jgi:hypothetical protein